MGEHAIRFSPHGGAFVDVCPLCAEIALEHGWLREGSPSLPTPAIDTRRKKSRWGGLLSGKRAEEEPALSPSSARISARRFLSGRRRSNIIRRARATGRPSLSLTLTEIGVGSVVPAAPSRVVTEAATIVAGGPVCGPEPPSPHAETTNEMIAAE